MTGALNGVSLTVEKGEFTAIMGASGSGKTTLLNLVAGLDRPSSGRVDVGGTDIGGLGEAGLARFRRDHIGFVFHFFYLLANLTAEENVLLPAQLKGQAPGNRTRELFERLGINDVADRYPGRMSGAQQQRVAIPRALINQPTLLLADEPTGALDTHGGEQVMDLLAQLHRDGQTILLVTHDVNLATRHATRVISVTDGQIVDDFTPENFGSRRIGGVAMTAVLFRAIKDLRRRRSQSAVVFRHRVARSRLWNHGAHVDVADTRPVPRGVRGTEGSASAG